MCKEIFLDPETSKISIREINLSQINKENLAKLDSYSKKFINNLNKNLSVKNIYNALFRLKMKNNGIFINSRGNSYAQV